MYHQPFYSHHQGMSNHYYMPAHSFYNRSGPQPTPSHQNLHFTHDFDRYQQVFGSMPTGAQPFYDSTNHTAPRWKTHFTRIHPMHAFHFQDKSTLYYMSDPVWSSDDRITIQLTKVHIGPNGDQQRVFVEQEFSNEVQFKRFVRNLRENFEKTFNHRATGTQSSSEETTEFDNQKSGVFVVEEPDEEPKVYPQQGPADPSRQSPLRKSIQFEENPRRRKTKRKYRRQYGDQHSSQIFHAPSYTRYYEPFVPTPPPRLFMNENEFPWLHQNYHRTTPPPAFSNRSRVFINENLPPRFSRTKNPPSQARFTHVQEQQARVQRTRSECRPMPMAQGRIRANFLHCAPKFYFSPKASVQPPRPYGSKSSRPLTPFIYPPRHLRLFPSSNRF